ncbi:MAG: isoprenoid biosynthesis glyoxalase ElbB [Deltaproteobacteria bacterium]|nr:isoprenoid biosynthesis glyoxalase ElbB [Deltaproteobacteria bacterium]
MGTNKKVGMIFSGCGVFDGTEIHEAVACMLALEREGLEVVYLAPDINQLHVVNHVTGNISQNETRSVLVESSRITRGKIEVLEPDKMDELDGVLFPGGFGAAKNLSDYALKGDQMTIDPVLETCLKRIIQQKKPIAALCVSPVILAKMLGDSAPLLTLGSNGPDAENLTRMGAQHQVTTHEEVVVDTRLKIVTGPCYMLDASISNIFNGAEAVIKKWIPML